MEQHLYNKYREDVKEVLQCKIDEFKLLDYDQINEDELWRFLIAKKWRKPKEDVHLYEIVSDIFSLKVSDLISFAQIEQFRTQDLFSEINADELQELLKR